MQSEAQDLSLADQLLVFYDKNRREVTWGAVAVALIGLAIGIYFWRQNEVQVNASEALSQVLTAQMPGQNASPESLLKVVSDYPGSDAARRALLIAAGDLFTAGKYKEAQTQFDRFMRDYPGSSFAMEAMLGTAAAKEAQGMTNEAITAYKEIADRHPNESVTPQARFALGRLYQAQGKLELARENYMQAAQMDPSGALGSEANMSLAELFAKHPDLVPKQPAPAATAMPTIAPNKP